MTEPGLPDPESDPQFYEGTTTRRLLAWMIDAILVGILTVVLLFALALPSLGLVFFIAAGIWLGVDILYRWMTLSGASATLGMRAMGIELRDATGRRFSSGSALVHTVLYELCLSFMVTQVISIVTMLGAHPPRSLPDLVLGSAMINRPV